MDRRSFLKGSGIALAGAIAAPMLGACTPQNQSNSAEVAEAEVASSSVRDAWYGAAADPSSFDIANTLEADVVVCGVGAGGIVATAYAAQKGLNVIAIEKGGSYGGIKDDIGVIGASIDGAAGLNVDKLAVLNEHTRYANGWCDPRVTRVWVDESGATFDWIAETVAEFGATPYTETDIDVGTHGVWPMYQVDHGFHCTYTPEELEAADKAAAEVGDPAVRVQMLPGISDYLVEKAVEWGADIHYLTSLVQLVQDDSGAVTGVIAQEDGGNYIQINASKGVILATGGYEADPDLLEKLNPESAAIGGFSMVQPGCVGDGIKAGIWAGGTKDEIPTLMTFARAAIAPDASLGYPYQGATCWMGDQPFLKVNLDGECVCCETAPYDYPLHVAAQQKEHKLASIWDSNYKEHITAFHTIGCSRILPSETVGSDGTPSGEGLTFEANDAMIKNALDAGIIQTADTISELAEKLRMPAAALEATVARYNELAEKGVDEDFGKPSKDLIALTTPPYYGSYFGGHVLCTLDGLKIDQNMRVLTENKEAIPGLFAIGNCSGSMYAATYPELFIGNANARTITQARHVIDYLSNGQ